MFKIVRFPSKLEPFFDSLRSAFHWEHFEYFRTLVLLVAFAWNRRNVSNLYRHLDKRGRTPIRERMLRPIAAVIDWRKQRKMWKQVLAESSGA
ncbi:MAG TPA: hypothetical protein ENN09_00760 [Planctomycetes bacterium]|nr:hypothetical protein [Planctomycetota bacterium]